MAITTFDLVLVALLALATPVVVVFTAPSFSSGIYRLKLIFHTLGMVLLVAPIAAGVALLLWGLATGSKALVYSAILPFIFAFMTRDLVLRRYSSFLGLGPGPFRQFWHETRNLWRSARNRPNPSAAGQQSTSAGGPHPGRAPGFSFKGDLGHAGARIIAPLAKLALDRMTGESVSVLPVALHLDVKRPAPGEHESTLDNFRRDLVVRRRDGGALTLSVDSEIPFLRFAVSPQLPDGSYVVAVGLLPDRIVPGRFSGTIAIETGDVAAPHLEVPVTAKVE